MGHYNSYFQSALGFYSKIIMLFFLLFSYPLKANNHIIEVGDARIRNQLQFLNDSGASSVLLTTWPIYSADSDGVYKKKITEELSDIETQTVFEMTRFRGNQVSNTCARSVEFSGNTAEGKIRDFRSFTRNKIQLSYIARCDRENFGVKLQLNGRYDLEDEMGELDLYGTYIFGMPGHTSSNWVVGVGSIERWWGPGNDYSLILSNNALPVPSIFFENKAASRFEFPLLQWLGNWKFVSFIGQLESNRVIPKAKLTGMRFAFQPKPFLEIGLSRSIQWGGNNREQGFRTFIKSLIAKDENKAGDAGNQLGGIDIRLKAKLSEDLSVAFFYQTVGEDEAGYFPAKKIHQLGAVSYLYLGDNRFGIFELEYINTIADPFDLVIPNTVYEHSIYRTGYRYRGHALGASIDNDSEALSVGLGLQDGLRKLMGFQVSYLQLNKDGFQAGNTISTENTNTYHFQIYHEQSIQLGELKWMVGYLSEEIKGDWIYRRGFSMGIQWQIMY